MTYLFIATFVSKDEETIYHKTVHLQLCAGLKHMHSFEPPYAHNDVKPGNVLVTYRKGKSPVATLMDFGSARPARKQIRSRSEALQLQVIFYSIIYVIRYHGSWQPVSHNLNMLKPLIKSWNCPIMGCLFRLFFISIFNFTYSHSVYCIYVILCPLFNHRITLNNSYHIFLGLIKFF